MGLLDGLEKLGLKNIDASKMYEKETKQAVKQENIVVQKVEVKETDYLFVKKMECPVCDSPINNLTVKSGRARLIQTDRDLRPIYENFEPIKYEPVVCQCCGYAVMGRYFAPLAPSQKKAVMENISMSYNGSNESKETLDYQEALERMTLTLASAIVKRAKASEKAYICLKAGWLCRSYKESLDVNDEEAMVLVDELSKKEREYLDSAYEGFVQARLSEGYPMAGMDETTLDYLLATMAMDRGELDVASKMVATILQSVNASTRIKDKARELKDELVIKIKQKKSN